MNNWFDITQREHLDRILKQIDAAAKPSFGRLSAQAMVEHLVDAVEYSNGKKFTGLDCSEEEAAAQKAKCVHKAFLISRGVTTYLDDATVVSRYASIEDAFVALHEELDAFDQYCKVEGHTAIHPAFGHLDYQEWVIWHGLHFSHHFRQFGLE